MSEENKAIARRYLDELWNKNNPAVRDELSSFDHQPGGAVLRAAFPDIQLTIDDQVAEGDKVLTRYTVRGTHKGEYAGVPPTNKQVTYTGMWLYRIEGGKIVERWGNNDRLGLLQQIGAIPSL